MALHREKVVQYLRISIQIYISLYIVLFIRRHELGELKLSINETSLNKTLYLQISRSQKLHIYLYMKLIIQNIALVFVSH